MREKQGMSYCVVSICKLHWFMCIHSASVHLRDCKCSSRTQQGLVRSTHWPQQLPPPHDGGGARLHLCSHCIRTSADFACHTACNPLHIHSVMLHCLPGLFHVCSCFSCNAALCVWAAACLQLAYCCISPQPAHTCQCPCSQLPRAA